MSTLRIELFGPPRITCDLEPLRPFPTQRSTSLFSFLVVHRGNFYSRDTLAGTFWGEHPDSVARRYLRTDLWRIRDTLRRGGRAAEQCLVTRQHLVGFDREGNYWLDLQEFERRLEDAERLERQGSGDACERLEEAIALYRGDLLQGLFDDWCFHEQERCRALFLLALEHAMVQHTRGGNERRALELGRRLLAADPLRESIHRDVMRLLYRTGDRPSALRQFEVCAETLRKELDVAPMGETVTLYHSILGEAPISLPALVPARVAEAAVRAEELRQAAAEIRLAQTHLRAALHRVDVAGPRPADLV